MHIFYPESNLVFNFVFFYTMKHVQLNQDLFSPKLSIILHVYGKVKMSDSGPHSKTGLEMLDMEYPCDEVHVYLSI